MKHQKYTEDTKKIKKQMFLKFIEHREQLYIYFEFHLENLNMLSLVKVQFSKSLEINFYRILYTKTLHHFNLETY